MEIINFADQNSLVGQFLREMRDVRTQDNRLVFRNNIHRIGQIMAYEISKRLSYKPVKTTTCLGVADEFAIADGVVIATILRAGLPLHQGFLSYFDKAENAFVSAYRKYREGSDEFDVNIEYIASPSIEGKVLLLVDPMLATGGSACEAIGEMVKRGCKHITLMVLVAAPEGIKAVQEKYPDVNIYAGALDDHLNEHGYIVPGLGDAGDRIFGTK